VGMKSFINNFLLKKFNYAIRRPYNGFSLNYNADWIKSLGIKTVLDIGANEGQFAGFISKLLPDSDVYSFEPLEMCFNKLKALHRNNTKIHPNNYAVGDDNKEVDFFLNDFSPSSSMLKTTSNSTDNFPFTKNQSIVKVEMKKLDDVVSGLELNQNILVKIDVQGVEDKVLAGGENFFKEKVSILFIETSIKKLYENEPSFEAIYNTMTSFGFTYKGNLDQLFSPINGEVLQVDAIFMKKNFKSDGNK
jgi:FkbM family methyltransferase